jgi:hypothetical protein
VRGGRRDGETEGGREGRKEGGRDGEWEGGREGGLFTIEIAEDLTKIAMPARPGVYCTALDGDT